ncbi:heavy metal translocating P-type ATPase [Bacillus sp. MUM 13]|uniref:heavy metal translocating P-type ATPase n=1 Tax=Bacillus sp. MUM 13 TaxID=1678001 RepID=UPI0008F5E2AA|nr:heavy metal translocating P-type ATPase [Bacillus sp. MUM 13]OIK11652.1 cadmium-translocating P-type ATPase [Bacillus sp. MUM 13]
MSAETNVLKQDKPIVKNSSLLEKAKPHIELICALFSGVLILAGWLLAKTDLNTASIVTYLFAFIIGGYAKAKEGIQETIENRELNVEMLMILAAIGSSIIGYWTEGAILIFIFAVSGALETYTMNKSHKEISSLMNLQPEEALRISISGIEERVPVAKLNVGDRIIVKPGERVPSDAVITEGQTNIDEAAITGESIPLMKTINDEIFAGTVNLRGTITAEITKPSSETLFQKIILLVQTAQSEKSPSQLFIEKFEGTYVKVVLLAVFAMMFLPHFLLHWSWNETLYRAMILLVVASPCALVASIMPATLSAISNGARHGILFKGGIHLENLGNLKAIALDKTGTLTKGKPVVTDVIIRENLNEEDFLYSVASIENYSNHPLASAIVKYAKEAVTKKLAKPHAMEDISGNGVQGYMDGSLWKIGRADFVGKKEAEAFHDSISLTLAQQGKTIVFAKDELGIAGIVTLKDIVRDETAAAMEELKKENIYTVMLTGDGEKTAKAIADESHIIEYVSECLPETKVDEIKKLKERFGTVAMVGDGINDAPALATASVGIAMGEGTDVALETADVVLMKNDLPRLAEAVRLSKKMNKIIKQNVIFSISVIMLLILSNFLQFLDLPYGVIGHEGSTILVILNSLRLLKLGKIK